MNRELILQKVNKKINLIKLLLNYGGDTMENELLNIPFIANEKIVNICTYKTQGQVKGVFYPQNEKQLIFIYNYYCFICFFHNQFFNILNIYSS